MKKRVPVFAMIAVIIAAVLSVTACGDQNAKEVELVDFPATVTEESQKLGETYTLRRTVSDTAGNEYDLTADVKTTAGGDVTVVSGRFELTDIAGYTVTYTAAISEKDQRTCVVTIPCFDGDAPVINIPAPSDGTLNDPYTLPVITFTDYTDIEEQYVKVYFVEGETLTEQTLEGESQPYTFTPKKRGVYRITAYAKDSSGNDFTRTADFIVDSLQEGEAFDPACLTAMTQISALSPEVPGKPAANLTYVPAAENTDKTYGGAYWSIIPDFNGWAETKLVPRLDCAEYAKYDVVTFWMYIDSTGTAIDTEVIFFNDSNHKQRLRSNQWNCVELDAERFSRLANDRYLFALIHGVVTGVRVGEIMGRYTVEYSMEEPIVTNVTATSSATVSFTVSSTPADVPYTVSLKAADGTEVTKFTQDGDDYTYTVDTAGIYTLTVAPEESVYYGSIVRNVEVKNDQRIEVETNYPAVIQAGDVVTLAEGKVVSKGEVTGADVAITVYKQGADGVWTNVTSEVSDNSYTASEAGKLKIEYASDDVETVTYYIDVAMSGEIFNPALESAGDQCSANGKLVFVPAADNTDETYGGAYHALDGVV